VLPRYHLRRHENGGSALEIDSKRLSLDLPLKLKRKSEPASPRVTSLEVEDTDTGARDATTGHGKMLSMVDEQWKTVKWDRLKSRRSLALGRKASAAPSRSH
jgi:hypothetical protein